MQLIRNRYRVLETLAETLYGSVFLCQDLDAVAEGVEPDAARVVLKQASLSRAMQTINAPRPKDEQAPDDPRQEKVVTNALCRLGCHRHLVRYRDDFIDGADLFFVQDFCSGGDLYAHLSRGDGKGTRPLGCAAALRVLRQVAAGTAFLHTHDMAHRDLSLENVMLCDGVCQVGDFGLATRRTRECDDRVGKSYYMAPEVVAGGVYDAKAADVWSLGVLLFILLTGSPLVADAATAKKTFHLMKMGGGVDFVLEAWGVKSAHWGIAEDLLAGMLVVEPSKRFTVLEVLDHDALVDVDNDRFKDGEL